MLILKDVDTIVAPSARFYVLIFLNEVGELENK